jgi:uncharacterized protein (DUF58 family)
MTKRYRVKITPSGYIYILLTIFLSIGVANTGNNLLYLMVSLMLAFMVLSGLSSLVNLFFLDISLIPHQEVFVDTPTQFRLIVHKRKGQSFFLSCETNFGSVQVPFIKERIETPLWLKFPKRGLIRIETLRIHSGFPLGFFRRYRTFYLGLEVLVYPKPIPRMFPSLTSHFHGVEEDYSFRGELSDEIKELRSHRQSDPIKWVDWKATARKGEMVVRDFYRHEGDTLVIDLSKSQDGWEKRLSEACYFILEGYRKKLSMTLILPDQEIGPGRGTRHKRLLLEALTLA